MDVPTPKGDSLSQQPDTEPAPDLSPKLTLLDLPFDIFRGFASFLDLNDAIMATKDKPEYSDLLDSDPFWYDRCLNEFKVPKDKVDELAKRYFPQSNTPWKDVYTMLAGWANKAFPGAEKYSSNIHQMMADAVGKGEIYMIKTLYYFEDKVHKIGYKYVDVYRILAYKGNIWAIKELLKDLHSSQEMVRRDIIRTVIEVAAITANWDMAYEVYNGKSGRIEMLACACGKRDMKLFTGLLKSFNLHTLNENESMKHRFQIVHYIIGKYGNKDFIKVLLHKYLIPNIENLPSDITIEEKRMLDNKGEYTEAHVIKDNQVIGSFEVETGGAENVPRALWQIVVGLVTRTDPEAIEIFRFFIQNIYQLRSYKPIDPRLEFNQLDKAIYMVIEYGNKDFVVALMSEPWTRDHMITKYSNMVTIFDENFLITLFDKLDVGGKAQRMSQEISKKASKRGYVKLVTFMIKKYKAYSYDYISWSDLFKNLTKQKLNDIKEMVYALTQLATSNDIKSKLEGKRDPDAERVSKSIRENLNNLLIWIDQYLKNDDYLAIHIIEKDITTQDIKDLVSSLFTYGAHLYTKN